MVVNEEKRNEKWFEKYGLAKEYYEKHGHLLIPISYEITKDGITYKLGKWIGKQRETYRNKTLLEERQILLNEIEMVWDASFHKAKGKRKKLRKKNWLFIYDLAKQYYKEHGDLLIPNDYTVIANNDIYKLGEWIKLQRKQYKKNELEKDKIELLNEICMIWDSKLYKQESVSKDWLEKYELAKEFYKEYNDLLIPIDYIIEKDGIKYNLGNWIVSQRRNYREGQLSKKKIDLLNQIGMVWKASRKMMFTRGYNIEKDVSETSCASSKEYNLNYILYSNEYDESIKTYIKWINDFTIPKRQEMDELLKRVQNGDGKAKQIIATSYLKYVVNDVAHYIKCEKDLIDYVQDANIYLLKQIDTYATSEKFHICVVQSLKNYLIRTTQRKTENKYVIPRRYSKTPEENEIEKIKKISEKEFFQDIKYILTELEYEIICNVFHYGNPLSDPELLGKYKIVRERKRQLKNKALEKIKDYIENCDKDVPYYNFNARNFYEHFKKYNRSDINQAIDRLLPSYKTILYKVHGLGLSEPLTKYVFENNKEYYIYISTMLEIQNTLISKEKEENDEKANEKILFNYIDSEQKYGHQKEKK